MWRIVTKEAVLEALEEWQDTVNQYPDVLDDWGTETFKRVNVYFCDQVKPRNDDWEVGWDVVGPFSLQFVIDEKFDFVDETDTCWEFLFRHAFRKFDLALVGVDFEFEKEEFNLYFLSPNSKQTEEFEEALERWNELEDDTDYYI